MKRLFYATLAILLLFTGCASENNVIREYETPDKLPSYMTRLYPEKSGDERYALLLRKYDEVKSVIAVSDTIDGEPEEIYTLPDGTLTYELSAGGGFIAFYQLTAYTDGSINYALKVVDTEDGNRIHSPFSKTVSEEDEVQTRFIVIFGRCVYYLTTSKLLEKCRVMKYDVETEELSEFLSFDLTENAVTSNSSCTFISENNGYLSCGVVEGGMNTVKTYNLRTGKLVAEKILPDNVAIVFYADRDDATGLYTLYYAEREGEGTGAEKVGFTTASAKVISEIFTASDTMYLCREVVKIYNNVVIFNVEETANDSANERFSGVMANVVDSTAKTFPGSLLLKIDGNTLYDLSFDKKGGYEKLKLKMTEIK